MKKAGPPPQSWQPFTFRGVGSFAHTRFGRLFAMLLVVAAIAGFTCFWLGLNCYLPRIDEAASKLPEEGAMIRSGRLVWPGGESVALASGPFLGISVDPVSVSDYQQSADLQLIFTPREMVVASMFGYSPLRYPAGLMAPLNRSKAAPWWGAWRIFICLAAGACAGAAVFLTWWPLALVYAMPSRLIGFYLDRAFSFWGAVKLCLAGMMPGALFMCGAIWRYSAGDIGLPGLAIAFGIHFLLQWLWIAGGILGAPKLTSRGKNPFDLEESGEKTRD
jgi:hypothetical protein